MSIQVNDKLTRSIVVSVNPNEMGIETVKIVEFDLADDDYILDGEYSENDPPFLIRRPVMLLSLDHLRNVYRQYGELGKLSDGSDPKEAECRRLSMVPSTAITQFGQDIELRKSRLQEIKKDPKGKETELQFNEDWMKEHSKKVEVQESNEVLLAPVVWKTLTHLFS